MQTTVLQMTARIGDFKPAIGRPEIATALLPRYPAEWECNIDLTGLGDETPGVMYELAARRIEFLPMKCPLSEVERPT